MEFFFTKWNAPASARTVFSLQEGHAGESRLLSGGFWNYPDISEGFILSFPDDSFRQGTCLWMGNCYSGLILQRKNLVDN